MRKRAQDSDMPIEPLTRVDDFLPPPDKLIMSQETIKVTISLSKSSIDFFKQQAKQHHTKYQKMIRRIVDQYAQKYGQMQ